MDEEDSEGIIIEVFGIMRDKVKWIRKEVKAPSKETTLEEVLKEVPEVLTEVVDSRERIRPGYIVLINGRHAQFLGGLKAKVRKGDVVSVFPPGAGG